MSTDSNSSAAPSLQELARQLIKAGTSEVGQDIEKRRFSHREAIWELQPEADVMALARAAYFPGDPFKTSNDIDAVELILRPEFLEPDGPNIIATKIGDTSKASDHNPRRNACFAKISTDGARAAMLRAEELGGRIPGHEIRFWGHGEVKDLQIRSGRTQPYAFAAYSSYLTFYFRKPSMKPPYNQSLKVIRKHFANAETNPSGEVKVNVRTPADVAAIFRFIFPEVLQ